MQGTKEDGGRNEGEGERERVREEERRAGRVTCFLKRNIDNTTRLGSPIDRPFFTLASLDSSPRFANSVSLKSDPTSPSIVISLAGTSTGKRCS